MKEVNAVQLRQSVGRVARALERGGGPILLRVGRKAVGVIVSIDDYRERFARDDIADREDVARAILGDKRSTRDTVEQVLDRVRQRR